MRQAVRAAAISNTSWTSSIFAGSAGGILVPLVAGLILQRSGSYNGVLYFFAFCAALFILGTLAIPFGRSEKL